MLELVSQKLTFILDSQLRNFLSLKTYLMKMEKDMNVGCITLLLNITTNIEIMLLKIYLMETEVTPYVKPLKLSIFLYPNTDLSVVLFTLLIKNL
jgi:hypothetical protein